MESSHNKYQKKVINNISAIYIEDDLISYQVVKSFLKDICSLEHALNSSDALKKMSDKKFELILLDIHLPAGMNGIELLKKIKEDSYYSKIPVIALTAFAMKSEKEKILNSGCDDYISKPFTRELLISTIKKYIK